MSAHATVAQLANWLPPGVPTPDDAERLLERASTLVDQAVLAGYDVDDEGTPTDQGVAAVLADATCAQVEQWLEVDEANDIDGLAGTHISVTGYSGMRASRWAPRMIDILRTSGLRANAHLATRVVG